jgi:hypothetical protein
LSKNFRVGCNRRHQGCQIDRKKDTKTGEIHTKLYKNIPNGFKIYVPTVLRNTKWP